MACTGLTAETLVQIIVWIICASPIMENVSMDVNPLGKATCATRKLYSARIATDTTARMMASVSRAAPTTNFTELNVKTSAVLSV